MPSDTDAFVWLKKELETIFFFITKNFRCRKQNPVGQLGLLSIEDTRSEQWTIDMQMCFESV